MSKVYGIDFGTTYSAISVLDDSERSEPVVIKNYEDDSYFLASAVYFSEYKKAIVIGKAAKKAQMYDPDKVAQSITRYLGKPDAPIYEFDGVKYGALEIAVLILKKIRGYASAQGYDVKDVVITCPLYFGDKERDLIKQAGEMAGFHVLDVCSESTAALLNYCFQEFRSRTIDSVYYKFGKNRKIMVYDLGGGSLDISLFDFGMANDGNVFFDSIKIESNDMINGGKWTERMFDYICQQYAYVGDIEISDIQKSSIWPQVEQAKKDMSELDKKGYIIEYGGSRVKVELTRQDFEGQTKDLVEQAVDSIYKLLSSVNLTPDNVDVVLLVGSSTLMPMIKNAIEKIFHGKVSSEGSSFAVVKGAALFSNIATIKQVGNKERIIIDSNKLPHIACKYPAPPSLTFSLGPAVFVDNGDYMIDNLLFIGDMISTKAKAIYKTTKDNESEFIVPIYSNKSKERNNTYIKPSRDENGKTQHTTPALEVEWMGDVHLPLPPNTPKGTPIRVALCYNSEGLEATLTNVETGESVTQRLWIFLSRFAESRIICLK